MGKLKLLEEKIRESFKIPEEYIKLILFKSGK